jgi:hypothetical protein
MHDLKNALSGMGGFGAGDNDIMGIRNNTVLAPSGGGGQKQNK